MQIDNQKALKQHLKIKIGESFMGQIKQYKQLDLVVLGAGESGVGAALLAQHKGMNIFVSDYGKIADKYKLELEQAGISYEEGQHSHDIILTAREIVKSPGIPHSAPIVRAARANCIPVISEIEFAGRYTSSQMIGITGSNGKTTTTMWLYHILREAKINVGLAGNVGFSLARQVMQEAQPDYYVVELSSFQLDDMYDFRVHVAIVLNITPDHLDRYNYDLNQYALAKMRILRNQTQDDAFIYWGEDPYLSQYVATQQPDPMQLMPFVTYPQVGAAAYQDDSHTMHLKVKERTFDFPISKLALQGPHNVQNAMAAALAALYLGVSNEALETALHDFVNVPHRLEKIAVIDGVRYINDSKATNINSTYYALRTMTTPFVLILGGTDKGNNYEDIAPLILPNARALVFLTTDTEKLHRTFDGRVANIAEARSMEEAVELCRQFAQVGDTVLLSPACASFDLFDNYMHRGECFRQAVLALASK